MFFRKKDPLDAVALGIVLAMHCWPRDIAETVGFPTQSPHPSIDLAIFTVYAFGVNEALRKHRLPVETKKAAQWANYTAHLQYLSTEPLLPLDDWNNKERMETAVYFASAFEILTTGMYSMRPQVAERVEALKVYAPKVVEFSDAFIFVLNARGEGRNETPAVASAFSDMVARRGGPLVPGLSLTAVALYQEVLRATKGTIKEWDIVPFGAASVLTW